MGRMSTRIIQFSTTLSVESCHVDSKAWPEAAIDIRQLKTPKHCKRYKHNNTFYIPVPCLWKYKAACTSLYFIIHVVRTLSISITIYIAFLSLHHLSSSTPFHMASISESIWVLSIYCLSRPKNHLTGGHFVMCIRNSSTGETFNCESSKEPGATDRVKRCKTMYRDMRQDITEHYQRSHGIGTLKWLWWLHRDEQILHNIT